MGEGDYQSSRKNQKDPVVLRHFFQTLLPPYQFHMAFPFGGANIWDTQKAVKYVQFLASILTEKLQKKTIGRTFLLLIIFLRTAPRGVGYYLRGGHTHLLPREMSFCHVHVYMCVDVHT